MLEGITWQQYFTVTGLAATVYYGLTIYKIYGKQLFSQSRRAVTSDSIMPVEDYFHPEQEKNEDEHDTTLAELEYLVHTIRVDIFEKAGEQADKLILIEAIKPLAANFGGLHLPAYRNALNNFIIRFGEELCDVSFSEEELEAEWRSLQS
jgi:hypothetical protein